MRITPLLLLAGLVLLSAPTVSAEDNDIWADPPCTGVILAGNLTGWCQVSQHCQDWYVNGRFTSRNCY